MNRTIAILLVALFLQPVLANGTTMKTIHSRVGGFSVQMPGEPTYKQKQLDTKAGVLTVHSWTVERGDCSYLLMYNDYPNAPTDVKAFFGKVRDGAVEGRRLIKEMEMEVAGYPGKGMFIADDQTFFVVVDYLVGARLYQLIVSMPKGTTPPPEAKEFLASFTLLKA